MTERYMFFNSTSSDRRKHQASDMADYWESFLSTGIIGIDDDIGLKVVSADNMSVDITKGKALIKGHLYINDDTQKQEVDIADHMLDRIDRIVVRYDNNIDNRYIKLFLIKGEPGLNPSPPALTREGNVYELSLAKIHIKAGKSFIEQSDIIDERLDESVCGLASSLVKVPTDVFAAEWKEFVAEYNKWFADLQGSAFATVDDVRVSENNMKREIANLNLQLEASKRVKEGVTFGTNFADSFGMEIDMARTSSDDALGVGQTVITVRDASEFKAGTEVTVYDDVNLERVNIASINGNVITLERGLAKKYKTGANIARTMAITNSLSRTLRLGVWGTYEYREVRNLLSPKLTGEYSYPNSAAFAKLQNKFFIGVGANLHQVLDGERTLIKSYPNDVRLAMTSRGVFIAHNPNSSSSNIEYMNYDTQILNSLEDINGVLIGIGVDEERRVLSALFAESTSGLYFREYSYDTNGRLVLLDEAYKIMTSSFMPIAKLSSINVIIYEGNRYIASIAERGNSHKMPFVLEIKGDFSDITAKNLWDSTIVSATQSIQMLRDNQGNTKIVIGLGVSNGITEHVVNDLYGFMRGTYEPSKITMGPTALSVFATIGGDLFAVNSSSLLKLDRETNTMNSVKDWTTEEKRAFGNSQSPVFLPEYDFEGEHPFLTTTSNDTLVYGKGELGYGAELTTNDIRFKTKPSKEVVTWIQHDEGLTITEATFGNINLDLSTIDDETQAVGYTTKEQGEVRLTIERESIDDDVKAYRILGGTS